MIIILAYSLEPNLKRSATMILKSLITKCSSSHVLDVRFLGVGDRLTFR